MSVTVLTRAMPERRRAFLELAESIAMQSLPPARWLVEWDYAERGPVEVYNRLADHVETDWFFRIDNDDLLELDHFDAARPYLTDDVDILYTWCHLDGKHYPTHLQRPFDPDRLRYDDVVPSAAFVRTALWRRVRYSAGNFTDPWDFYLRALDLHARMKCLPIVTYRHRVA